jgi:hypothetical protein
VAAAPHDLRREFIGVNGDKFVKYQTALFLGVTAFAFASAANATPINLVSNPGFEDDYTTFVDPDTGNTYLSDIPQWTAAPDAALGLADVGNEPLLAPYVHSGDQAAFLATKTLSQTITTSPLAYYQISFWYRDPPLPPGIVVKRSSQQQQGGRCSDADAVPGGLTAAFGSTQLLDVGDCLTESPYEEVIKYAWGTGSDLLLFTALNPGGLDAMWFLDDVSVVAVDPQSLVPLETPEPQSLAVMAAGLTGAAALHRRRRARATRTGAA